MKIILFILLITHLSCGVYHLEKYDKTPKIRDSYGVVVLDLIEFEDGDKIYITYNTYEGEYWYDINYEFSNSYPSSGDPNYLQYNKHCDSYSSTRHEHNKTDIYGNYYIEYTWDYYYYFEFTKPNDTRYLIMGYDLSETYAYYLIVDNTRFSRATTIIIIVCSVIGGILLIGGIALIWVFHEKISCECFLGLFSCLNCCHKTYSYDISSTSNYNNKSDKLLTPIPSTQIGSQEEKNDNYGKPLPPPEEKPIELPTSNYNPNEVPEQPYYMQDNQTQNYAPPQNVYGQNDIYANNNQYPPNPPPGDPQNYGGYNPQIYNGGGYYQ